MWPFDYQFFTTYKANKYVLIRSRRAATINRIAQLTVFLYVGIYAIYWKGKHLLPQAVHGSVRMTMQHPVQNCNPMHPHCKSDYAPMSNLPYCEQFKGKMDTDKKPVSFVPWSQALNASADDLDKAGMKTKCLYKDNVNLTFRFPVPGTLFMETRASKLAQHSGCEPSHDNDWSCDGSLFTMSGEQNKEDLYYADMERFTLLIDHAYRAKLRDGEIRMGKASDFEGCAQAQGSDKCIPIPKKPDKDSELPSVFQLFTLGNIVSIADLLRLANPKEGDGILDKVVDGEDGTLRWNGGVLQVNVEYESKHSWSPLGSSEVTYVLSSQLLAQSEFKNMFGVVDDNGNRMVHDQHGLLILANVQGTLFVFDLIYLVQVLTASVGLMAVAAMCVDWIMTHVLQHKSVYKVLCVQPSVDFDLVSPAEGYKYKSVGDGPIPDIGLDDMKTHGLILEKMSKAGGHGSGDQQHKGFEQGADYGKEKDDLMHILLMFEHRLNALDGLHGDAKADTDMHVGERRKLLKVLATNHPFFKDNSKKNQRWRSTIEPANGYTSMTERDIESDEANE